MVVPAALHTEGLGALPGGGPMELGEHRRVLCTHWLPYTSSSLFLSQLVRERDTGKLERVAPENVCQAAGQTLLFLLATKGAPLVLTSEPFLRHQVAMVGWLSGTFECTGVCDQIVSNRIPETKPGSLGSCNSEQWHFVGETGTQHGAESSLCPSQEPLLWGSPGFSLYPGESQLGVGSDYLQLPEAGLGELVG